MDLNSVNQKHPDYQKVKIILNEISDYKDSLIKKTYSIDSESKLPNQDTICRKQKIYLKVIKLDPNNDQSNFDYELTVVQHKKYIEEKYIKDIQQ